MATIEQAKERIRNIRDSHVAYKNERTRRDHAHGYHTGAENALDAALNILDDVEILPANTQAPGVVVQCNNNVCSLFRVKKEISHYAYNYGVDSSFCPECEQRLTKVTT